MGRTVLFCPFCDEAMSGEGDAVRCHACGWQWVTDTEWAEAAVVAGMGRQAVEMVRGGARSERCRPRCCPSCDRSTLRKVPLARVAIWVCDVCGGALVPRGSDGRDPVLFLLLVHGR